MKKLLCFLMVLLLLLPGCSKNTVEPLAELPHEIMGTAITLPDKASGFALACYVAADRAANTIIDTKMKKKPEFIAFEFSSDVMLSRSEKEEMMALFSCYGVEISEGARTDLADIDRGITIAFDSIEQSQTSDCDLTIPVKIYYGRSFYVYCADFVKDGDDYVLFRFELWHRTRYIF